MTPEPNERTASARRNELMPTPAQPALDATSPLLQQLRQLLLTSGYCEAGIAPTLSEREMNLPGSDAPPTQLNTLLRLFFVRDDCRPEDVAAAVAPLTLSQLLQAGVLREEGELIASNMRVQPYERLLFAFHDAPDAPPEEATMLVSPSSLDVAHLMIRRRVRNALDLGTGSGFLASLLSPFCDKVQAIDVNPAAIAGAEFNARWNGLSNITFHTGDLFEPVREQRFDLIVCNPPFLIAPVSSAFSTRYRFKHSGLEGDTFCINLAREASQRLNEDGYFHMIFQFEEYAGQPWSGALAKSFSGLGCDVWVARMQSFTAEEHISEWLASLTEAEQEDAANLGAQARQYFQQKNVVATSTGLLTLRRASHRKNYLWFDESPEDRVEPYGESVAALFEVRTKIEEMDDAGLLQHKLKTSPHLRLLQTSNLRDSRWSVAASELSLTQGLKYSFGDVDENVLKLVENFSGGMTAARAIGRLQQKDFSGRDLVTEYLPKIRELLWYGFLVPVEPGITHNRLK
jgi:methylase of polypeptide subunit release factors